MKGSCKGNQCSGNDLNLSSEMHGSKFTDSFYGLPLTSKQFPG